MDRELINARVTLSPSVDSLNIENYLFQLVLSRKMRFCSQVVTLISQ